MAEYLQRGETLDYTNATDELIAADTVVTIGKRIGVTGCPIPAGKTGSLHVVGIFQIKKTGTAAMEIGQEVNFDGVGITDAADNGQAGDEKVTYTPAGYVAAPAAAGDGTVLIQING